MMKYDHIIWADEVLKKIDSADSASERAELIMLARDEFTYLKPAEKADVFVLLLGKNRKVV